MAKVRHQPDRRMNVTLIERPNGRKWSAVIEKETMHPVYMQPKGHKEHVFFPLDTKYLRFDDEDPRHFSIDWNEWESDLKAASDRYEERLRNVAAQMSPGDLGAAHYANRSPDLIKLVGPPPMPVDFPRAARAGNKWMLGLKRPDGSDYPVPPWAAKYVLTPKAPEMEYPDVYEDADQGEIVGEEETVEPVWPDLTPDDDDEEIDLLADDDDDDEDDRFGGLDEDTDTKVKARKTIKTKMPKGR